MRKSWAVSLTRPFVSISKWSSLAKIGASPIARGFSLLPLLAPVIPLALETEGLRGLRDRASQVVDYDISVRLSTSFLGLAFIGLGALIFNVFCPTLLKKYVTHLEYVALAPLITRERYNQIVHIFNSPRAKLALRLARIDNYYWLDRGFINAKTEKWERCEPNNPESLKPPTTEQVVRVLWYNYVYLDNSAPLVRAAIAILFALGFLFLLPPMILSLAHACEVTWREAF
ncbi:hypothetical protein [Mangrovicoccus sp. HB161399]|uniref:hypothetical protein n=1 Tax=Mangrovicoccus sp. HB161399 TaxID=2720392 RepID=UPI00155279B7|nr:hypothetical protein [Mangrovicoccus sp. HB161399]